MPFELMLLYGFAALGVLVCIAMYIVSALVLKKSRRAPALEQGNGLDPKFMDDAMPADIEDTLLLPEKDSPRTAPGGDLAETRQLSPLKAEGQESMTEQPTVAPREQPAPPPQRETPVFTPLARDPGGIVVDSMRINIGNAQDIGRRDEQQDAFAITPIDDAGVLLSHGLMAVVCDGMGGLKHGAQAANAAALTFMQTYLAGHAPLDEAMQEAVYAANEQVLQLNAQTSSRVGTTLCAAAVTKGGLWFISVGDSHIYLHRAGKLYQLNTDHNYYTELIEKVQRGEMKLEDARRHPERAHLTSFIGKAQLTMVDANAEPIALRPGDRILLCSDGLFKTLSPAQIAKTLSNERSRAHEVLVDAVKNENKQHQDNVTAVVLYLDAV